MSKNIHELRHIDADVRSMAGQSRVLQITHTEGLVREMLGIIDDGNSSAFEKCMQRNGLLQTIEINNLPHGFDRKHASGVDVKAKLEAFRQARAQAQEAPGLGNFLRNIGKRLTGDYSLG